nr:MAG TPA: hypothetical protein [Caudoviricetes sp.]
MTFSGGNRSRTSTMYTLTRLVLQPSHFQMAQALRHLWRRFLFRLTGQFMPT